MTTPPVWIPPLVSDSDSDLADWQAGTRETFLAMACAEVQKFCGWHIAPTVIITGRTCWVGGGNVVLLKSRHVVSVDQVTIGDTNPVTLVASQDYTWEAPKGWLRLHPQQGIPMSSYSWRCAPSVTVNMTHGHPETPQDVKAVIFELVATAMELPASNATEVMTEHYRYALKNGIGISLSDDQKSRLGHYRLRSFGGMVRP